MTKLEVLDHGFVELLDIMGDEREVARAARISYDNFEEDRTLQQDMKLVKYLWDNQHTSPFEMIETKWRVKLPIFVARQWIRHRTANVNEMSMRYTDMADKLEFYVPDGWRQPDKKNRQGSEERLTGDPEYEAFWIYSDVLEVAELAYKNLQELGVANEMARMVLPVSAYTEFVWKNDLHNTLRFLKLRADSHASWEIQQYANAMVEILKEHLPNLMEVVWCSSPSSSS